MDYGVFEIDFIKRTLQIVKQYDEHVLPNVQCSDQFEVTLLINCLLGLLVLPKERRLRKIPNRPIRDLDGWGLRAEHLLDPGFSNTGQARSIETLTLREAVADMRNSVAHILFRTYAREGQIADIELCTDRSCFKAKLSVAEFKHFVEKLAATVT